MLSQRPIATAPPPPTAPVDPTVFIREILSYPPASGLYQGRGLRRQIYNPEPIAQQTLLWVGRHSRTVCTDSSLFVESTYVGHRLPAPIMIIWQTCDDTAPEMGIDDAFAVKILTCARPIFMFAMMLFVRDSAAAHMNLVIVNRDAKEVERFEPHGDSQMCSGRVMRHTDRLLAAATAEHLPGYTYIDPLQYCPRMGPQTATKYNNYCMAISTLYGHLRIVWPHMERSAVVAIVTRLVKKRDFMDHYIGFMHTVVPFESWDEATRARHTELLSRYTPE